MRQRTHRLGWLCLALMVTASGGCTVETRTVGDVCQEVAQVGCELVRACDRTSSLAGCVADFQYGCCERLGICNLEPASSEAAVDVCKRDFEQASCDLLRDERIPDSCVGVARPAGFSTSYRPNSAPLPKPAD